MFDIDEFSQTHLRSSLNGTTGRISNEIFIRNDPFVKVDYDYDLENVELNICI